MIGLKNSYFPLIHLSSVIGQFVIGHLVIGQFVIGQFNKPITLKVIVKINQPHLSCSSKQPITTLVSVTIETSVQTPKLGLSSKWRIFSLEQWLYFRRQWWFLLSYGTNVVRTIQTSSSGDMFTCSDEVQPSTALFYIASQQLRHTEVNIHPTEIVIPLHRTLVFPPSKIFILFNNWKYRNNGSRPS